MTWIFAILAVLLVGGVAVVASGRLGAMPEPERRAGGLLGDGAVQADDLRRVRFTPVFRGYRMDEVDALLDRLATQLEQASVPVAAPAAGSVAEPVSEPAAEAVAEAPSDAVAAPATRDADTPDS